MNAWTFVLAALATYRLTRLVTADQITMPLRTWVLDRNQWLGYLVTCDWCFSMWVAPWVTALAMFHVEHRAVELGLFALSLSALTGFASVIEARLES